MSFSSLGLSAELLRAVAQQGYDTPTPVQQQVIPLVLAGRDILVGAQTGTGKTAGFTLPMLQLLSQQAPLRSRPIRALILAPTRELAAQVDTSVRAYGEFLSLRSTVIVGGVAINPQISQLRRGVDIVVATPGRLLDHLQQQTIDLSHVKILVLDEADRMLDMGFLRDIRRILTLLPQERQNLLFSATFSNDIRQLASGFLENPEEVQVAKHNSVAESISQLVLLVDQKRKREMLSYMIGSRNWKQVLVFTRTKHGANRLAEQLQLDGLNSTAIHGNKSQAARTKALNQFKEGRVRVLVATDVAARGLDIHQLPLVVNFELPDVPEDYIHRIGRTGRAGSEGQAVSLVCAGEKKQLQNIERLLKQEIPQDVVEGYEPDPTVPPEPGPIPGRFRHGQDRHRQDRHSGGGGQPHRGGVHKQGKGYVESARPNPDRKRVSAKPSVENRHSGAAGSLEKR